MWMLVKIILLLLVLGVAFLMGWVCCALLIVDKLPSPHAEKPDDARS
jgi:hypothetical protein